MRRKIIFGIFIVVVLCFLSSPMPMNEMGQSFDNQMGTEENIDDFNSISPHTLSAIDYVGYVDYDVPSASVSGSIALGRSYVIARTLFLQQIGAVANEDDPENYALCIYWSDTSTLAWKRDTAAASIKVRIHLVEFSSLSGVTVTEYGEYDTLGAKTITEVVMADTFVVLSGWTTAGISGEQMDFAKVTLTSTTQVTVDNCEYGDSTDRINDVYFQVVECTDFFVQRGTNSDADTSMTVDISTAITIADTVLLTQTYNSDSSSYYQMGSTSNTKANWIDTNTFQVDKYDATGTWYEDWQVIEWEGWNVQYVASVKTEQYDLTYNTTISSVTTSRSIPLHCGSIGAFAWTGTDPSSAMNDDINDQGVFTEFIDATTAMTSWKFGIPGVQSFTVMVIEFATLNSAPVNDAAPVCTNLDDGDNLYGGRYKLYEFNCSATDVDGYADIWYLELRSYDYDTTTLRWTVKYIEDTNTFSEESGSSYIHLVGSTYSKSGVNLDVTFKMYIEWGHPDAADDDLYQVVGDDEPESDEDSYPDTDYDYETRLDFSAFSLNDESGNVTRGNYDSIDSIIANGTAIYYGSGNNYPPSNKVDVWVSCGDVAGSPWSDLTLTSGVFSMTVDSDDVVGEDTYTFKIVQEGAGSGGTDLCHASHTDTYIADRVQVQYYHIYWLTDREDIGTAIGLEALLWYDYDDTVVSDGTVTINGVSANYVGQSWQIAPNYATVMGVNYNNVQCSGNTYGITAEDQNGQSQLLIWDRIQVQALTADDDDERINVGTTVYLHITLWYDYDNTNVTDGTVLVSGYGIPATYSGASGIWDFNYTKGSVGQLDCSVISCSGNTHGITEDDMNGHSITIIWDRVRVVSYTINDPSGDNRNNIGTNYTLYVELHYNFDEQDVADGTVTINGITGTYLFDGQWRFYDLESTVMARTYNNVQASGNTHGITVEDNTVTQQVIWDRIKILTTSATDNYIIYGSESTTVNVTAELDYDSHALGSGDTLYMNNTLMTWDTDHFYIVFGPYSVMGSWVLFVNSSSANEATHGITTVWLNSQDDTVATDRVKVISYDISDARDNINDYIWINVTVQYESDSSTITDGTIVVNGYSFSHLGSGIWRHNRTQASVVGITFDTLVAAGNTRGITLVNQNEQSQLAVWDRIYVVSLSYGGDTRVDVSTSINFDWELHYDYDEADVTDGTVTINGYSCSNQGSGVWRYTNSSGSVGDLTLDDIQASGNTHGIITEFQNSKTVTMIWDRILILTTTTDDGRIDYDTEADIVVTAELEYDSHSLGSGDTLYMNNTAMSWNGTHFVLNPQFAEVDIWGFYVNSTSANEDTYGITVINLDGNSVNQIWDRINVVMNTNMTWRVIGRLVNVSYTGTYEYDGEAWTGYATIANTTIDTGDSVHYEDLTFATVGNRTFYATAVEDAGGYGLTALGSTTTEWCVWDDISVSAEHFWTQQSATQVWLKWDSALFTWSNTSAVSDSPQIKIQSKMNGTEDDWGYIIGGYCGDLIIGEFNPDWYYANISIYAQFDGYDWIIWTKVIPVTILHSIQTNVWYLYREGDYYTLLAHTNYENSSAMAWDDMTDGTGYGDATYYGDYEGMHEWLRDKTVGMHNVTILLNAGADKGAVDRNYVEDDLRLWYNFTYVISDPDSYDCQIVILDNLYDFVPFETFEVYNNDTRIYTNMIRVVNGYHYNITVKNRFGDYVNTTAVFEAAREMVVFVNVYSFKFMSWYNGFLLVNITRGGVTYSEIIMPMEIIEFNLYAENYNFTVAFTNGTIKYSFLIEITNSTGYVITGDTIADVYSLIDNVNDMVDAVNITVTTIEDNTLTIQLMFDWSNTTLYNQTINIIAAFGWDNTTIYNQTISILNAFNSTNTVLYDQIILIQNMFDWDNTTIYNQTISILNAFNATNTVIYDQTISILSNISSMNSTIYSQTVDILTNIGNVNSTLYTQTLSILTNIENVNSTIYAQTVTILSNISNVNTTIYAQTLNILSNITNVNSTIYSQTVNIISYIWNNANSIYNQTLDILSDIQNTNTTIYDQTVTMLSNIENINSTIYSQTVDILNYIWNNATSIYNQTVTMLSDISNVNTTLYSQTVTLLSNIANIDSDIETQTVTLLSYIWNNANSIYNQTVTMLSNIENVNSTIYTQTLTILADIANLDSDIGTQTTTLLASISNVNSTLYDQTIEMLTDISNVNSTLYTQTLTMLANIANLDSDIVAQTVTILADISNVNSTIYTQTLSILSDISNMNTTLYSQTVTLLSNIENVNSTLYTQTLTILSDISNVNTTLYDQTVTVLTNIQNMNSTIYQQTIDILTNITNVNSTIYSQVLTVVNNLAELNATIYLVDDPTNLNFLIAGHVFSDDYCDLTIVSSWHNATLTIYENGVSKVGPVSELNCPIRYTLNETIGSYNLSVYVDAGVDSLWYNISYVVEGIEYGQVNVYNSQGTGFDATYFIVYINGSRYFDNRFYNRTDYVYNVTVTDYFGYVILQNTYDWARMIDVGIDFYVYKIKSEVQGQAIYFNLTRTGGAKFSQHLLADEILTYYLVAGEYTYEFRRVARDLMAPTYIYYEGTFILSTDKTHIIDGTNLRDLEDTIELIPAGKANVKPLKESVDSLISAVSLMQLGMWGLAAAIIIGMAATATEDEIVNGKIVKKRKIPKQLKKFAFKRGAQNPKSERIPDKTGRWNGMVFRDEVPDWRDKM